MRQIDPVTYAPRVRRREVKILMLNARRDRVVPVACTQALWRAFGEPEIVWYDAGHYSAIEHIGDALKRAARFLK